MMPTWEPMRLRRVYAALYGRIFAASESGKAVCSEGSGR